MTTDAWSQRTDLSPAEREQMRQLERDVHGEEQTATQRLESVLRSNRARCKSPGCRRPIFWAVTARGKRIPIDMVFADEPGDGQFELRERDGALYAHYIDRHEQAILRQEGKKGGRTSHFATCPQANQHRGGKR